MGRKGRKIEGYVWEMRRKVSKDRQLPYHFHDKDAPMQMASLRKWDVDVWKNRRLSFPWKWARGLGGGISAMLVDPTQLKIQFLTRVIMIKH